MSVEDTKWDYYRGRAAHARNMAERATCLVARDIHLELARRYQEKAGEAPIMLKLCA